MSLAEPTTTLTDYALAAVATAFSVRLFFSVRGLGKTCHWLWAVGFLTAAATTATGGTFHGFRQVLETTTSGALWNLTVFLIGFSAACMVSGTRVAVVGQASKRWLIRGAALSLLGLAVQQSGIVLYRNLNHNDICHLIQLGGLYFLYRGAVLLEDPPSRNLTGSK